ncbi:zinc finger protein 728-like isoform X7 [Prorops nasuta]|uniref:zinc finger protein 728-like isoform X7 n=1 Tax=Prorops nasuta TaxID=863751 RepID=UPI0034CE4E48
MSSLDYLDLCRLCLVKDCVSTPIFGGEGDVRQIFLKIAACLPVKVAKEDKLPKKICNDCVYKVELCYDFWNTTANSEKQLLQWLGGSASETKQNYASDGRSSQSVLKSEGSSGNRLGGPAINNMGIGIMDNIGLGVPMMISSNNQQQISSVPMDTSSNSVQTSQAVPGPSSQTARENAANPTTQDEEEISTEDEENSDDDNDAEGLPVKEESEEDANSSRNIEPTTFVNVSLACDEAGPSGLQRQKIAEIPEMTIPQTVEGDPKSGYEEHEMKQKIELDMLDDEDLSRIRTSPGILIYEEVIHQEVASEPLKDDSKAPNATKLYSRNIKKPRSCSQLSPSSKGKSLVIYECETCGKILHKKSQFFKHRLDHEEEDDAKPFNYCEKCDVYFDTPKKLRKHKVKAHQVEKPCQCAICGKCFKTEEFLKIHLKQHNKRFRCDLCGVSKVSAYDLRLHKKRHNQEFIIHCQLCGKGFYTNQTLERHLLTHTGEKPFACNICNARYASATYLATHVKSHGQREKYKCTSCPFESYWKAALKVHLKIHSGENQIKCNVCEKSVSSKTYLQTHMRIHSGEKPHVCEMCGKAFSVRKYLIVHLRTHTGEKPYECKVCRKRFTQQGSLNAHARSHKKVK